MINQPEWQLKDKQDFAWQVMIALDCQKIAQHLYYFTFMNKLTSQARNYHWPPRVQLLLNDPTKSKAEKWFPHVKCQGWWLRCIDKIGTTTKRHLRLVAKMMLSQSVTMFWKCIISQNLQHFQRSIQAKWQSAKAQKGFPARQVTALVTIIALTNFAKSLRASFDPF